MGLFRAIFVSGKPLAESTIADYAFKLDVPLVNWFITRCAASPGLAMFIQVVIVVAEILIGLALMGGLLTSLAPLFSLLMFVASNCYLNFWMLFASITMLFGAGQIFGLDYYVTPAQRAGATPNWSRRLSIMTELSSFKYLRKPEL